MTQSKWQMNSGLIITEQARDRLVCSLWEGLIRPNSLFSQELVFFYTL